eukprot:Blabericola_migrator_1__6562@NODE_3306_length_1877_cov_6_516022_g2067_i0_p2_GENE_NODE_3306_length_1877_cov_6_516022_g2067_i0NODE_3306_length_1877_cov_6_516022_g2067_i0_p2_ORF_typecomplete_len102_score2_71Integrase_H2C2/PF17921_1/2_1e06Integrase_H2C2/PF17921_1/3_4e03_NODE_3306_length_1877_cov_6_516022_g2067_i0665970
MFRGMRKFVWWRTPRQDVQEYVRGCVLCTRHGPPMTRTLRGALSAPRPLNIVSLDHVGPRQWRGVKYFLQVTVDQCTRFIRTDASKAAPTAVKAAELFVSG